MSRFDMSDLSENAVLHFVGIGGISMSGLAEIAQSRGYKVKGSDRSPSHITKHLEDIGVEVFIGQREENVEGADLVIYTAAVKADNPELAAARKLSIPTITRAQFLGAIMKEYPEAIGIAGTHGKTTTTSILAHALIKADTDPTITIGGELDLIGGNVRAGKSKYFLTEACEYTNSFLEFFPRIAVITNIEEDHLDFFKDLDDIISSFKKFALLTKDKGVVIACGDDKNILRALNDSGLNIFYYGLGENCYYRAVNIKYSCGYPEFDVEKGGKFILHLALHVPGEHNIKNALAAIAVCDVLNLDIKLSGEGIQEFTGTHRRFEKKGSINGATIIDDYAHHPTEIKATLKAARNFTTAKLWCIFQPHTYSRTRTLWDEFVCAFDNVDELIITHIFPAREVFDGVTRAEDLTEQIKKRGVKARYIDNFDDIANIIKKEAAKDDFVITMGAGDVYEIADNLCK